MSGIVPGTSLDIWEGEELRVVGCVGEEKGKLRVILPTGKELKVPEARVANVGGLGFDPGLGPAAIGKLLQAHEVEIAARAETVDVASLWEVLTDEGGQYTIEELAELAFGSRDGVARSATLRRLVRDTLHFTRKKLEFSPRSREDLGETIRKRKAQDERARLRAEFLLAARALLALPVTAETPPWPKGAERFLETLRDLAVRGAESERAKEAEALLHDLGWAGRGEPPDAAFEVLVRLRVLSPDENLLLARHAVRRDFPPEVLAEAERLKQAGAAAPEGALVAEPWRRDLTHLVCYAIDDPETTEVDDALSLEALAGGGFRLGVHIADPTAYVALDGILDRCARERATTYYLPEERILMLPPAIAEEAASLNSGSTRAVLSFLVEVGLDGVVHASEIVHARVRIERRLTYEQADALVAMGGGAPRMDEPLEGFAPVAPDPAALASLPDDLPGDAAATLGASARLARALLERRAANGALILKGPDLDVKVRDGAVILRRFEPWTPAWVLVSEAMILGNALAAAWLQARGVPAIYRRQPAPDTKLAVPRAYDPVAVAAARRSLKRTEVGLTPGPHAGLGLPCYVQVTSPLRRYQDLACHHQLRAALRGERPPFDAEALWRVAATTDEAEKGARDIERGNREYWLLKHIERQPHDRVYEATITRAEERRTFLELTEFVYLTSIPPRSGHKPGRKLRLAVEAVNPRAGRLVMRDVG